MFFLCVVGIVGAFDSNVLPSQVDVFACQHVAGTDAYVFTCFDIDAALDAAYSAASLLNFLVVVLVFAFFFADGKAQSAS